MINPRDDDVPGTRDDVLIERALELMQPLVDLLLAQGVSFPRWAAAMRSAFLQSAAAQLAREGRKVSDSALSVVSGIHRKEVRNLMHAAPGADSRRARDLSLARQVATRWMMLAEYRDRQGKPRTLPVRSADDEVLSFERLVASVSTDVHPRSVLDHMLRLGIVARVGNDVRLSSDAFVPTEGFAELALYMSENVGDHLAAATANLQGADPRFLEHSVFSDELRPASIEYLRVFTREMWREMFKRTAEVANECVQADRQRGFDDVEEMRMRFGVYFYAAPKGADPATAPAAPTHRARRAASKPPGPPAKGARATNKSAARPAVAPSRKRT
jgi:hypothetical protein